MQMYRHRQTLVFSLVLSHLTQDMGRPLHSTETFQRQKSRMQIQWNIGSWWQSFRKEIYISISKFDSSREAFYGQEEKYPVSLYLSLHTTTLQEQTFHQWNWGTKDLTTGSPTCVKIKRLPNRKTRQLLSLIAHFLHTISPFIVKDYNCCFLVNTAVTEKEEESGSKRPISRCLPVCLDRCPLLGDASLSFSSRDFGWTTEGKRAFYGTPIVRSLCFDLEYPI
jgi:hypothetical protein